MVQLYMSLSLSWLIIWEHNIVVHAHFEHSANEEEEMEKVEQCSSDIGRP